MNEILGMDDATFNTWALWLFAGFVIGGTIYTFGSAMYLGIYMTGWAFEEWGWVNWDWWRWFVSIFVH